MLAALRAEGELAVRRFAAELDGLTGPDLLVPERVVRASGEALTQEILAAIDFELKQARRFAKRQRASLTGVLPETASGVFLGHRHVAIDSVGCYARHGCYRLISLTSMPVVAVRVAGVEHVIVCTPPRDDGTIHRGLLYSGERSGADSVYAAAGVQAMGARGGGLPPGAPPVDMVVGPGTRT